MDLQSRKISFIEEFLRVQNEEIISGLEKYLKKKKNELFEKNLKPMSLKQFNKEIDQALDDSANGSLIAVNDLKDKVQKWD